MRFPRAERFGWIPTLVLLVFVGALACLPTAVRATGEVPRGDGTQTGDGSSPFTGLAQTPSANLFMGSAASAVSIEVPPGRNGMTPQLALAYSSGAGPSPYGYGWDLPLGRIQRNTKHGVPSCTDERYRNDFVVTLPGETIECTLVGNRCEAAIEESFAKIVFAGGAGAQNRWDVWSRSGAHYVFGELVASTDGASFSQPARTGSSLDQAFVSTSATSCQYTFSWALTSVEDPNGNRIDFQYLSSQGVLYPHAIRYGGTSPSNHVYDVGFEWGPRPIGDTPGATESLLIGTGGFPAVLTKRLQRIAVTFLGNQVRAYDFAYHVDRVGRQTFLAGVTLFGATDEALIRQDGEPAETVFRYQQHDLDNARFGFSADVVRPQTPNPAKNRLHAKDDDRTYKETFDINGDGFVDLVDTSDLRGSCPAGPAAWNVFLGSRNGLAATASPWHVPDGDVLCFVRDVETCGEQQSCTRRDTLDLDGDGIADFVETDFAVGQWRVYFGDPDAGPGGTWGFLPAATYPMPVDSMRRSGLAQQGGVTGSADFIEMRDMNGDSLPDLVRTPFPLGGNWSVWFNRGRALGFDTTPTPFSSPVNVLAFFDDGSRQRIGTFDMNGDGLPDVVEATSSGYWNVYPNTGAGISLQHQEWAMPSFGRGGWGIRDRHDDSGNTYRDLVDMNGDGLPDLVDSNEDYQDWLVLLNRGSGFAPAPAVWAGGFSDLRHDDGTHELLDIDGDGFVDRVMTDPYGGMLIWRNLGGAWKTDPTTVQQQGFEIPLPSGIMENPVGGRTDLLVETQNGVGGTTTLSYRPSTQWTNTGGDDVTDLPFVLWTLTRIESDDGMCDADGANCVNPSSAHTLVSRFDYVGGRFDPLNREFRGFYAVTTQEGDGASGVPLGTLTTQHQSRSLSGRVINSWRYEAGDGGGLFARPIDATALEWECADPQSGQTVPCPETNTRVWVRLKRSLQYAFSNHNFGIAEITTSVNEEWDSCGGNFYGNVSHSSSGDVSGTPRVHVFRDFACHDTATAYVVDRPVHERTTGTNTSATERERWMFYDGGAGGLSAFGSVSKGNLTRTESWLDQWTLAPPACTAATGKRCVSESVEYDAVGNAVKRTDTLGRVTRIDYDVQTSLFPHVVTNPLGHKVATTFEPRCSVPIHRTVPYTSGSPGDQPKSRRTYDPFCRLERTAYPDEDIDTAPHQRFVYKLGGVRSPTVTLTYTREPNHGAGTLLSSLLSDALGRPIQVKREDVVDGTWTFVAAATMEYDGRGNAVRHYSPFTFASLGEIETFTPVPSSTGVNTFAFDAAGRTVASTRPDGSRRETSHLVARQTETRDECFLAANCTGSKTVEKRDAFGRVTETWVYEEPATLRMRSRNVYDDLGQLLMTMQGDPQASETTWNTALAAQFDYDSLGRKVFHHDPDSGDWTYGYDAGGNLIVQDDPKAGQHLQWCYDGLDRVTLKCARGTDFNGASSLIQGQCAQTCDPSEVRYGYDAPSVPNSLGRMTQATDPTGLTKWMEYDVRGREKAVEKVIEGVAARTRYTYDAADHVTEITYPDGEKVSYAYDASGRVRQVGSATASYASSLTYDIFGRPKTIAHSNGVTDRRSYGGASQNHRIVSLKADLSGSPRLDFQYAAYSANGMLTSLQDAGPKPNAAADNTAGYAYDGLGRVVLAIGGQLGIRAFQYDHLGNITGINQQQLTYNANQPHLLERLGSTAKNVFHDANGNRILKQSQQYYYDREDRLIAVDDAVQFSYDYSGARVRTQTGAGVTRHYSDLFETAGATYRKYYFAGPLLIASREIIGPWQSAALAPESIEVRVASLFDPGVEVLVGTTARNTFLLCLTILLATVVFLPGTRRPVVGIRLRRGSLLGVAVIFAFTTLPWPLAVRPALAGGGPGSFPVHHYHLDHLGSTQLVTDQTGTNLESIRYRPYGEVRGRWKADGSNAALSDRDRFEFAGYETEFLSGLQYSGSRYYDPSLGMFLTHDPKGQYPNPYTYGGWNPINGADPDGRFFFLLPLLGQAMTAVATAATTAATAAVAIAKPVIATVTSLQGLQGIAIGALKGAAKGAALGVARGLLEGGIAEASGGDFDARSFWKSVKNGAIQGGVKGAFGSLTSGIGGLGASPNLDVPREIGTVIARVAARSILQGTQSATTSALTSGADFGPTFLSVTGAGFADGLLAAFVRGVMSSDDPLGRGLSVFAQKASVVLGAPLDFAGGSDLPTNFRTMLTGTYEGYVGGVLASLPSAPQAFVQEMLRKRDRFDAGSALKNALTKRGEANVERLFRDQARRLFDHHAPNWAVNLAS